MSDKPTIYEALIAVMRAVDHVAKRDRNESQGFSFRGVDAVVNAVGPKLREVGVFVVPLVEACEYGTVEVGRNRTPMAHVRATVTYRWYGPDGSYLDTRVVGEAMDSGDKATPKAMSVAFRTALLQALALPTDEPDPDAASFERSGPRLPADIRDEVVDPETTPGRLRALHSEVQRRRIAAVPVINETGDEEPLGALIIRVGKERAAAEGSARNEEQS